MKRILTLTTKIEYPEDYKADFNHMAHLYVKETYFALRKADEEIVGKREWPLSLNTKAEWTVE